MLASFSCEPLLTGLGAGGYMLVCAPEQEPVLLDFFVEAPGRGATDERAPLLPIEVSFGEAVQVFHVGAASCGVYGLPAGLAEASRRFGSMGLDELTRPAAALARAGVALSSQQAYVVRILGDILLTTPECAALYARDGKLLREGEKIVNPELGDALDRLGNEGPEPFYRGDIAAKVAEWVLERGGALTSSDLAGYEAVTREPVRVRYRGAEVLTNPPPSAGGTLIGFALALLEREASPPTLAAIVEAMERAQAERTPDFLEGLEEPDFLDRFFANRLGSTTHISVLDADRRACSVTCSNGEGSGMVVPDTGIHVNNMMGEQDLNPLGFHSHAPGRRMPSMMAPTVVLDGVGGSPRLVLGSGGSNRIRSAILQTIVNVLDRRMDAAAAVLAPRLHVEEGILYAEPGVELAGMARPDREIAQFRDRNLFFGGVHAVQRDPATGALSGGGDPRRGGVVIVT